MPEEEPQNASQEVVLQENYGVGMKGILSLVQAATSMILHITSGDQWEWLVAARQMGLERIAVRCTTSRAENALVQAEGQVGKVERCLRALPEEMCVAHVKSEKELDEIAQEWKGYAANQRFLITYHPSRLKRRMVACLTSKVKSFEGKNVTQGMLKHANLGGLSTEVYGYMLWGGDAMKRKELKLPVSSTLLRDPVRFLEPLARLTRWRRPKDNDQAFWNPREGCMPGPLGEVQEVLAFTIFLGCEVVRPLSVKEKGQILDIQEGWGKVLAEEFWASKNPLPCRIPTVLLAVVASWGCDRRSSRQSQKNITTRNKRSN